MVRVHGESIPLGDSSVRECDANLAVLADARDWCGLPFITISPLGYRGYDCRNNLFYDT